MNAFTVGSLFSGIGGLDLGLERAGMNIAFQVEIDPWCQRVLAKHWPEVPRHDDVRTCAEWWGGRPSPDLVAGGFPCQPVSSAGKRLAQGDPRWLWPAFADTIRQLRPGYVLVENVPGLLARGMGDVLGDLAALGYDADWDCVSAADVGAPHLRKRVWIVAHAVSEQLRHQSGRRNGSSGSRPAVTGDDGAAQPLADAEGQRGELRQATGERLRRPASGRLAVADAALTERRAAQPQNLAAPGWRAAEPGERDSGRGPVSDWWAAEPGVGRVAHGIPRRVDRLRGLGNAVVPQVAEHIGRLILAAAA